MYQNMHIHIHYTPKQTTEFTPFRIFSWFSEYSINRFIFQHVEQLTEFTYREITNNLHMNKINQPAAAAQPHFKTD